MAVQLPVGPLIGVPDNPFASLSAGLAQGSQNFTDLLTKLALNNLQQQQREKELEEQRAFQKEILGQELQGKTAISQMTAQQREQEAEKNRQASLLNAVIGAQTRLEAARISSTSRERTAATRKAPRELTAVEKGNFRSKFIEQATLYGIDPKSKAATEAFNDIVEKDDAKKFDELINLGQQANDVASVLANKAFIETLNDNEKATLAQLNKKRSSDPLDYLNKTEPLRKKYEALLEQARKQEEEEAKLKEDRDLNRSIFWQNTLKSLGLGQ